MRLIDADALDFSFDRRIFGEADENYVRGADDAIGVVQNAPTIEAALVRHGRWISTGAISCKCSECGHMELKTRASEYAYCPNCGAKMDGGEYV